ncbi:hypothetical protein PVAP13_7NG008289 [Panicum virgatum]|uniref:Uncharacterized protein n=1 Tax=Panicum virgatum TaxID=38727 RepID=A0A8T0PV73_PANVG|nr:hypothetical protein PVAP13_7NG008289 [Panicum virgatum]
MLFDEAFFPFAGRSPSTHTNDLCFLDEFETQVCPIGSPVFPPAGSAVSSPLCGPGALRELSSHPALDQLPADPWAPEHELRAPSSSVAVPHAAQSLPPPVPQAAMLTSPSAPPATPSPTSAPAQQAASPPPPPVPQAATTAPSSAPRAAPPPPVPAQQAALSPLPLVPQTATTTPAPPSRRLPPQVYRRHAVHGPITASGRRPTVVRVPVHAPGPVGPPLPAGATPIPPVVNQHSMTTRGKLGFR